MRQQRLIPTAILLAALALVPAHTLAFGPPAGDGITPAPAAATPASSDAAGTVKRALEAQGDISPQTLKALERDPEALKAVGKGNAGTGNPVQPQKPEQSPKGGSSKAMYGDIIIHK